MSEYRVQRIYIYMVVFLVCSISFFGGMNLFWSPQFEVVLSIFNRSLEGCLLTPHIVTLHVNYLIRTKMASAVCLNLLIPQMLESLNVVANSVAVCAVIKKQDPILYDLSHELER